MSASKYIILGGGMVAGYAAKELVKRGSTPEELTIISADDAFPYSGLLSPRAFLQAKTRKPTSH